MQIQKLEEVFIKDIVESFKKSNWTVKSTSLFEQYLDEQIHGTRLCWIAHVKGKFAGYVTLKWKSKYQYFSDNNIPEIVDLNVLPIYRNQGIGTALLDIAESSAGNISNWIGLGVGLYNDYGAAQRLYIKRGYIPDGNGITYNYQKTIPGKEYQLDDDLILWFTKKI